MEQEKVHYHFPSLFKNEGAKIFDYWVHQVFGIMDDVTNKLQMISIFLSLRILTALRVGQI